MKTQSPCSFILFLIALFLLCGFWAGSLMPRLSEGTLWHTDECFTAERSREMLILGDYSKVHFYFEPNFNKPPLQYFLTTLSMQLMQDFELSVRIWSLLYGTGCLILTAMLYLQRRPGFYFEAWMAAAFLATYAYWVDASRLGLLDTGLTFYTLLTIYFFFKAERNPTWWLGVACFSILGSLQKIPLSLFFVLILIFLRWLSDRKNSGWMREPYFVVSLLSMVIGAISWPIWQIIHEAADYSALIQHEGERLTAIRGSKNKLAHIGYLILIVQKWLLFGVVAMISILAPIWTKSLRQNRYYLGLAMISLISLILISSFSVINRFYMAPILPLLAITGVYWVTSLFNPGHRILKWVVRLLLIVALLLSFVVAEKHIQRPSKDYSLQADMLRRLTQIASQEMKSVAQVSKRQSREETGDSIGYALLSEKGNFESIESLSPAFAFYYGEIQPSLGVYLRICKSIQDIYKLKAGDRVCGMAWATWKAELEKELGAFEIIDQKGNYILFNGIRK